jgi:hypothetical protein
MLKYGWSCVKNLTHISPCPYSQLWGPRSLAHCVERGGMETCEQREGLNFSNIFTYSFYTRSSQKRKNSVKLSVSSYTFGIYEAKALRRTLMKLTRAYRKERAEEIICNWISFLVLLFCQLRWKKVGCTVRLKNFDHLKWKPMTSCVFLACIWWKCSKSLSIIIFVHLWPSTFRFEISYFNYTELNIFRNWKVKWIRKEIVF